MCDLLRPKVRNFCAEGGGHLWVGEFHKSEFVERYGKIILRFRVLRSEGPSFPGATAEVFNSIPRRRRAAQGTHLARVGIFSQSGFGPS